MHSQSLAHDVPHTINHAKGRAFDNKVLSYIVIVDIVSPESWSQGVPIYQ